MILTPRSWWAIGTLTGIRKTLRVRRLVCGRILAREEKREGEVIVQVDLIIPKPRPRRKAPRVSDAEREGEVA